MELITYSLRTVAKAIIEPTYLLMLIVFGIIWVAIAILFVSPFSYSAHIAGLNGNFSLETFIEVFTTSVTDPFGTFGKIFTNGIFGDFFSALLIYSIACLI